MNDKKAQAKEEFNEWLFYLPEAINEFKDSFPPSFSEKLDFSLESLNHLENWMLEQFSSPDDLLRKENTKVHDGISRYIGEVMRKNADTKWSLSLDDEDNVYFGLPVIVKKTDGQELDCPHSLATALLDRKEPGWLKGVVEYVIE